MRPFFSVLIVNYNAGDVLTRCLQALEAQDFTDFEVILVDNASKTPPDISQFHFKALRYMPESTNLGFAKGNNLAATNAKGQWLVLLNPDAFPESNWLTALSEGIRRYPDAVMFGSTQYWADHPGYLDGTGDIYHAFGLPLRRDYRKKQTAPLKDEEVFAPCAAASAYAREVFEKVGGFDETFFCYCEDVDLAFRIRLQGGKCMQLAHAIVHHMGSAITSKVSDFAIYYGMRNRIWVFVKNMPDLLFFSLLPVHIGLQLLLLLRYAKSSQLAPAWRGLCDALQKSSLLYVWKERVRLQRNKRITVWEVMRICRWELSIFWRKNGGA